MVFGYSTLNEISIIAAIDGEDCSNEESAMGYYGLIIWISLAIYLMAGQFVICEEYFVPILSALGDRWNLPEDVQGATLLAVGSSSPELFTAILGVIFYPKDNPGPGTNVGSAVFNMCIIIGLSAIFAPRSAKLQIIPFLRDSIAYMIGLIQLYIFYKIITPHYMDIWESILLTIWWIIYVIIVYRTDLLASRCCCCVPSHIIEKTIAITNDYVQLKGSINNATDDMDDANNHVLPRHKPSFLKQASVINKSSEHEGHFGVQFDNRGHPITDPQQITETDNIHIAGGHLDVNNNDHIDEDLQHLLDELNRKQRQNVNKGWVVVIMPQHQANKLNIPSKLSSGGRLDDIDENKHESMINKKSESRMSNKSNKNDAHAYIRRRTLMETLTHEREVAKINEKYNSNIETDEHDEISRGGIILRKFLYPWTKIFSWTLPKIEGSFALNHIYIAILLIIIWLGLLTFFVLDCCEKIGNCFNIPAGLLGITLLAVGSSLPDCISSIIVARQMKIDMAVANAFGSNIFDVNLCVGFSFILGSIANGCMGQSTKIYLGDKQALNTFSELIIAAAIFMVFLWLMIWCTLFRLEKWIGYILSITYVGYICVFTVLFVHDKDNGDDFGEN